MNKHIAYVHDRFFHYGGAQKVLEDLVDTYGHEGATIFVLFSPFRHYTTKNRSLPITTALPHWINKLFEFCTNHHIPFFSRLLDYRNLMPFYPFLIRLLRRKIKRFGSQQIIISSFAAVKNIVPSSKDRLFQKTVLYLHSPMQYIRDNYDEYVQKLSEPKNTIFRSTATYLKKRDKQQRQYDAIYTNSFYTAEGARKYYGMTSSQIWYPRLDNEYFTTNAVDLPHDYYLYIGRLVTFIRETDLIIRLFNEVHLPLIVMGSGPDEAVLKAIAGDTIIFIGSIADVHQKITITKQAKGLINLAKESCGIATMEALALGVPVFGYTEGGTKELVQDGMGLLNDTKDLDTLVKNLHTFHTSHFDRKTIQASFHTYYRNHAAPTV